MTSGRSMAPVLIAALSAPARSSDVDVLDPTHSAADGERDEDLLGGTPDDVEHGVAPVLRRGDVEERELVGALAVVAAGQLDAGRRHRAALRS